MLIPLAVRVAPLLVASIGLPWLSPMQDPIPKDPRFEPAAERAAEERLARIREEIAKLGTERGWAGRYYRGDGLGVNVCVTLAPHSGFVYTWSGCIGVYDRNDGALTERDGRLELAFTHPETREQFRGLAPVLVPVRWGERRYLIASDALRGFANAVNGGIEPRTAPHGACLLRSGDEARPVEGRPELPDEIAKLLLDEPVAGTIVSVHDSDVETQNGFTYRRSEASIDRGAEHGIWNGLKVYIRGQPFGVGCGVVIAVAARSARVRIRTMGVGNAPLPEAGWEWSTSARRTR